MTKEAEDKIKYYAECLADWKEKKAEAEERIKGCEKALKETLAAENIVSATAGDWTVELVKVAATKVVDTAKLKKDGLFEQYSKDRAAYEQVKVTNPNNEFLTGLEERRKKHIEDGKKQ